jgi:hypothetical protein
VKPQLPLPHRGPITRSPSGAPLLAKATPLTGTAKAPSGLFDQSESPTTIDPAEPAAPPGNGKAAAPAAPRDAGDEAPDLADEGDFEIGEVSRVVRLNDLAAMSARRAIAKKPAPAAAAQAAKEAAAPASPLAEAALESLHDEHHSGERPPGEVAALAPVVIPRKRRSLVPLLAAGGFLLVLVVGLVVFFAAGSDDEDGRSAGGGNVGNLALSADDPRFPRGTKPGTDQANDPVTGGGRKGSGGRSGKSNGGGSSGTSGGNNGSSIGTGKTEVVIGPDGLPLEPLTPDDVITQALKMSSGTQRCYQRALKEDPFLKVTSIGALLTISRDGKVTDVSLDKMETAPLGQCLVAAIKRWPFRKSTAGLNTKITLKFEQSIN